MTRPTGSIWRPMPLGRSPTRETVRCTACHVLPMAPERYEAAPVALEGGLWLAPAGGVEDDVLAVEVAPHGRDLRAAVGH